MITKVMNYCNNHFIRYSESPDITFAVSGTTYTIEADFAENYIVGQYIWICGSLLNDGAYKITASETGVLTVDTACVAELPTDNDDTVYIFGLAVPKDFVSLVSDIDTWNTANGADVGTVSEKLDDWQETKQGGKDGTGFTWQNAFANQLSQWKSLTDDIRRMYRYAYN